MSPLLLLLPRRPLLAPLSLSLGLGLGLTLFQRPTPLLLDSFSSSSLPPARVPVFKDGRVNPDAYGQISTGSILGMCLSVVERLGYAPRWERIKMMQWRERLLLGDGI